jgi:hypothetical protein
VRCSYIILLQYGVLLVMNIKIRVFWDTTVSSTAGEHQCFGGTSCPIFRVQVHWKVKAITISGHGGPWGCERLKLPHFLANQLTDDSKAVSLTCQPSFAPPQRRSLVLISVRGWVDPTTTVQLEGLRQFKKPMTSSGIEPAMSEVKMEAEGFSKILLQRTSSG